MTAWPFEHRSAPTRVRAGGLAHGLPVPVLVVLLLAVLAGLSSAAAWQATGGRWAVVETPSMGTAVPVGSLILTRPRPLDRLDVGDIVTYRPPNLHSWYTHRVVAVDADGSLKVQGDANGTPDPFPVTQDELVGQVVQHWPGLGWAVRALPTVLLGVVVLLGATHLYVNARWRSSVRVVGICLVFAIASLLLRPFVHPVLVATTTDTDGTTMRATVASTGILPTRVSGAPGQHVDLHSGEIGSVALGPTATPGGPAMVNGTAHLTGWWIVGVGGVSLLPMLWVLTVGLTPATRTDREKPPGKQTGDGDGDGDSC